MVDKHNLDSEEINSQTSQFYLVSVIDCICCGETIAGSTQTIESLPYCISCFVELDVKIREIDVEQIQDATNAKYSVIERSDGPLGQWETHRGRHETRRQAEKQQETLQQKVSYIMWMRFAEDNYALFGSPKKVDVQQLQEEFLNSNLQDWILESEITSTAKLRNKGFSWLAVIRIAIWKYGNGDAPLIGDSYYFRPSVITDSLADRILDDLRDHIFERVDLKEINTLSEARKYNGEMYELERLVFPQASNILPSYFRENKHLLGKRSRQSIENNKKGDDFENYFRNICIEYGVDVNRGRSIFFRRNHQNTEHNLSAEVEDAFTELDRPSGLPDYYIYGKNRSELQSFLCDHGMDDDIKISGPCAFVEVKYSGQDTGSVYLTDRQRKVIPKLTDAGIDVFFFIGTPENWTFKRSWID